MKSCPFCRIHHPSCLNQNSVWKYILIHPRIRGVDRILGIYDLAKDGTVVFKRSGNKLEEWDKILQEARKEGAAVVTGEGLLALEEVQLAGKRAMGITEFLRGQRGFVGSRLG